MNFTGVVLPKVREKRLTVFGEERDSVLAGVDQFELFMDGVIDEKGVLDFVDWFAVFVTEGTLYSFLISD